MLFKDFAYRVASVDVCRNDVRTACESTDVVSAACVSRSHDFSAEVDDCHLTSQAAEHDVAANQSDVCVTIDCANRSRAFADCQVADLNSALVDSVNADSAYTVRNNWWLRLGELLTCS